MFCRPKGGKVLTRGQMDDYDNAIRFALAQLPSVDGLRRIPNSIPPLPERNSAADPEAFNHTLYPLPVTGALARIRIPFGLNLDSQAQVDGLITSLLLDDQPLCPAARDLLSLLLSSEERQINTPKRPSDLLRIANLEEIMGPEGPLSIAASIYASLTVDVPNPVYTREAFPNKSIDVDGNGLTFNLKIPPPNTVNIQTFILLLNELASLSKLAVITEGSLSTVSEMYFTLITARKLLHEAINQHSAYYRTKFIANLTEIVRSIQLDLAPHYRSITGVQGFSSLVDDMVLDKPGAK